MLLDIQLKFAWSQFCTSRVFAVFSGISLFLTKLCILTTFSSKKSPMPRYFLPLSTPLPFFTHRRRWENVTLARLLVGELGLEVFLFKALILRFRRIVLLLHEELDCATLVYAVVVPKSAGCFCLQASICLH